jgi:hypothetical protein
LNCIEAKKLLKVFEPTLSDAILSVSVGVAIIVLCVGGIAGGGELASLMWITPIE